MSNPLALALYRIQYIHTVWVSTLLKSYGNRTRQYLQSTYQLASITFDPIWVLAPVQQIPLKPVTASMGDGH